MNWKVLLKILITSLMLLAISRTVDLSLFLSILLSLPLWGSLAVIVGYLATQILSAVKWRLLAQAGGLKVPFSEALKAYFIGMFINCFGLGMVGGDVARGVLISSAPGTRTLGLTSVVADRLHGLAVLAAIGGAAALIFRPDFLDAYLIWTLVILGFGIGLAWILGPILVGVAVPKDSSWGQKIIELSRMLTRDGRTLMVTTLLSLALHLIQIGLHWVMAQALQVEIPVMYLLTTVPFINILSSLPLSWNGVGVREAGYLFFFVNLHPFLSDEQAIAMGALWLLAITSSSVVGGIVAFFSKDISLRSLKGPALQAS